MNKTGQAVLITTLILGGIYFALIPSAGRGYGYMGYYGYHHGPSFWYWGGTPMSYDRNVRSGSRSGPNIRGGATGSGK